MTDSVTGAFRSLEAPTMVKCAQAAPVMAIIEHATGSSVQMRSVNAFDLDASVEFSIVIHGAAPIAAIGTVKSRVQNGHRYTYKIALETTPSVAASIEHAVSVAHARAAGARSPLPQVPPAPRGLTRLSVRVTVFLDVAFSVNGSGAYTGKATNLSTGGMLMNTTQEIPVGATLALQFALDATAVSVNGRVVAHQPNTPNYNIAFFDVRESIKETLARFVSERERSTGTSG